MKLPMVFALIIVGMLAVASPMITVVGYQYYCEVRYGLSLTKCLE